MRTLTYTGRAGRRRFGKDALLAGPHADEFTEGDAGDTLPAPEHTNGREADEEA